MSKRMDTFNAQDIILCQPCIVGKQHKEKIPEEGLHGATELLELIHSDICGPMQVGTYLGCKKLITFIDDFSWYCFVYLMKQKSEAFDKFM